MLKIPKGLKKKKKGKKGKKKDDELFDPEELAELERYKKEKQQKEAEAAEAAGAGTSEGGEPAPPEEEEEWKKFKALTSGVDTVLKKTQDELDRIKATSYYQKKPPGPSVPSETDSKREPTAAVSAPVAKPATGKKWVGFEEGASEDPEEEVDSAVQVEVTGAEGGVDPFEVERVEEEEEESEFEDDADDLFDTSYVDVVASGEVKLAYVPDSPENEDDFDPFDTSIVDKVIKVDPAEEKKKKLVSLGCAVEVLTGKLEKPVEVPAEIVKPQRRRPRPRDLLLGSFDEGPGVVVEDTEPEPVPRSILDDEPIYAEETSEILGLPPVTPLVEVKPISSPLPKPKVKESPKNKGIDLKNLLEEFVPSFGTAEVNDTLVPPVSTQDDVDDLDDEFAALASESLHKTSEKPKPPKPPPPQVPPQPATAQNLSDEDDFNLEDDPFDTSFAAQVLPGKFELKLIEKEILNENTAVLEKDTQSKINDVLKNSELSAKVGPTESEIRLQASRKDLLGGSTSDLSQLAQSPIAPKNFEEFDNAFAGDDPFDTSVVDKVVAPGKTELKFLEKELLDTPPAVSVVLNDDDDDFDPRADEKCDKQPLRPDNLLVSGKKVAPPKVVAFKVSPADLLAVDQEENSKVSKPLTPYYPSAQNQEEAVHNTADPFDTSYVSEVSRPGKLELQILEQELASASQVILKKSISDDDFDPRGDGNLPQVNKPVPPIQTLNADIISGDVDAQVKLHTPVVPQKAFGEPTSQDIDPFDTSIASGLIPGKAEIKILETELIYSTPTPVVKPATNITEELLKKNSQKEPTNPPLDNGSAAFNPFLSGGMDEVPTDNPFMSSYVPPQDTNNAFDTAGTNPFAFGDSGGGTDNIFGGSGVDANMFGGSGGDTNMFGVDNSAVDQSSSYNYENIFASQPATGMDIFGTSNLPPEKPPPPQNIFCSSPLQQHFEDSGVSSDDHLPKRPPPPRPGPPKETKDLILSVTGAMEATSSDLLDRLQATRTPSPTPMRDLHSPSPTHFGDLLDVDGPPAPPPSAVPQEVNLLGDDFDFSSSAVEPVMETTHVITESIVSPPQASNQSLADLAPVEPSPVIAPAMPSVPSSAPQIPPQPAIIPSYAQPVPPAIPHAVPPAIPPAPFVSAHSHGPPPVPPAPHVAAAPAPPPGRPAPPNIPERPKVPPTPARPPAPVLPPRPPTPEVKVEPHQTSSFSEAFGGGNTSADLSTAEAFSQPTMLSDNTSVVSQPHTDLFSTDLSDDVFSAPGQDSSPFTDSVETNVFQSDTISSNPLPAPTATSTDDFALDFSIASNTAPPVPSQPPVLPQPPALPPQPAVQSYNIFEAPTAEPPPVVAPAAMLVQPSMAQITTSEPDEFDAFAAKFESVGFGEKSADPFGDSSGVAPATDPFDPFASTFGSTPAGDTSTGFGADDNFDGFLSLQEPPPVPQGTPARIMSRAESAESNDDNDFNIFIKPKQGFDQTGMVDNGPVPSLAPPPKSPSQFNAFQDTSPRFNPFDSTQDPAIAATENIFAQATAGAEERQMARTDSQETPPTPLFDEDVSQPLEDFPRIHYDGPGWEMMLRQPNKKKITGQRFWKKIFVKLVQQGESPTLQLFNGRDDKDPFQELPLQPCYSVSEIGAQQFDQFGKIFTVKLQFVFYKERPGVRPGQVTKAGRLSDKLSQFAAYAIQGDYQGVKEFGSDLKKLGLPVEHAPQISQLFKIGSQTYEDMKQFSMCIEESLFRLSAHRDRALNYKMEEVQITAVDELYVEQNATGGVEKQIARVRLFFLGFLSGMPDVELGVNDLVRQGKEVVGRHDIIPVVTEEWIRLEAVEFHSCIQLDTYERSKTIKFKPPDAMYIELMRFRVRPPRNRELPLQLKCQICVTGNKVEIHGDILVPGFTSRKLGQIPCEDVMVRIPIPECWIYQFRVEKHFRYGSVKSAHRRTGKVKGIERFLGAIENMEPSLMEVTSGQAKYEHQHRALVWRMPRLPKEGQGAYTTHNLVVRLQLTSYDQIPDQLAKYAYVEFTMPATTVSHTTVRSVSIQDSDSDQPPEKYVRQLARCEYRVEIEHTQGVGQADYIAATAASKPAPIVEEVKPAPPPPESDSDSDSG
ncbi:hypothetical protein GE061_012107 [Apolygus lucorum]|uniref:Protein stoned-B-like n=1 Tax=Apolygus lucorum TaxID=248454 RepID=A0A8S9XSJ3_APOLU|nr:hypothetical protein GE061_012107 [Apolygus lucorum]